MQNALINLNGEIVTPEHAKVSVFDRSYLYGDSVYEVLRSYNGKFFQLEDHLRRLKTSAELCQMSLGQTLDTLRKELFRTQDALQSSLQARKRGGDAFCRIIVSRGAGRLGFGLESLQTPLLYTLIMLPLEVATPEQFRQGRTLKISSRLQNSPLALNPAMKTGNYLNSLLATLEAQAEGFDDAILLNADGHVTEGATFSLFYAHRGIIATAPLDIGILDGITRRLAIDEALELGIPVREVRFPRERLHEADEVFLTSTLREVFPVTRIDRRKIGKGAPGPLTQKVADAVRRRIVRELEKQS